MSGESDNRSDNRRDNASAAPPRRRSPDGGLMLAFALVAGYLAVLFAVSGTQRMEAPEDAPNIVLLILDTLRADELSAYGQREETSPALDDLAARGVRFATVETQSAWTRPSIASMLTSLYPRTVGIYVENNEQLNDRFQTLAETLHAGGYRTIGATANPHLNRVFNFHQGFDEYFDSNILWPHVGGLDPGPEGHDPHLRRAPEIFAGLLGVLDEETPEQRARPHYLQVDLMEVHEYGQSWTIEDEYRGLFGGRPLERKYRQAIRQLTDDVGEFVETLSARPGWDNTLFVITSDHGEGLYDHRPLVLGNVHGFYLYESCTEVPWILYATKEGALPAGKVIEQRVRLLDVMPTLLSFAGLRGPPAMVGRNVRPLLHDQQVEPAHPAEGEPVFLETDFRQADKAAVYSDEWIYVENRGQMGLPPSELQRRDGQVHGAATDMSEAHPDIVARLREALHDWEQAHPKTPPTTPSRDLNPDEVNQLRALGYLE